MHLLNLTKKQILWVFLAVYFFAALVGGLIML